MKGKAVSGIMLTLLLIGMLTLAFNIQPVKAEGTIYIRVDGSVDPPTAPILRDGSLYIFTDNIYDSIVVERGNVIIDGNGYALQDTGLWFSKGISSSCINNVTIRNTNITGFYYGVLLFSTSHSVLSGNNITANRWYGISLLSSSNNNVFANNITDNIFGIDLDKSSYNNIYANNIVSNHAYGIMVGGSFYNTISGNNITASSQAGVSLHWSSNNSISGNNLTANRGAGGIWAYWSSNNSISGNNITDNWWGILLELSSNFNSISGNNIEANYYDGIMVDGSSDNSIYHNNFVNNTYPQAFTYDSINVWDDGYPSSGNYWSDYVDVDLFNGPNQDVLGMDGIWDHLYVIDSENQDRYPLVKPWPTIPATLDVNPDTLNLRSEGQWITAYIELPEGYNVSDIDVSTVMLNDTIPISLLDVPTLEPVPTEIGDYDEDGIPDLMVKFDRATVESFIYSQGITYGEVSLTITGELLDGTPFAGTDVIFVNYAGDANKDGIVNILDAGIVSAHWYPGPPIGPLGYDAIADFNHDETVNLLDCGILNVNWGQTTPTP